MADRCWNCGGETDHSYSTCKWCGYKWAEELASEPSEPPEPPWGKEEMRHELLSLLFCTCVSIASFLVAQSFANTTDTALFVVFILSCALFGLGAVGTLIRIISEVVKNP